MSATRPYRLVRERDLPAYAGLKRTQISELIKRGEFPRPIKLSDGGRAKAWLEDELLLWQRRTTCIARCPPGKAPTESESAGDHARATQQRLLAPSGPTATQPMNQFYEVP
jgi:prophage regulatory protein